MSMLNQILIIGRLTRDPEVRQLPSGTTILNTSVAVSSLIGEQRQEKTEFFEITMMGKSAEYARDKVGKGCLVVVNGRLAQDTWQDKETGKNRSKVYIFANRLTLINRPQSQQQPVQTQQGPPYKAPETTQTGPPYSPPPTQTPVQQQLDGSGKTDEDIPF